MPTRPQVIAHRGLPREHAENSLPGFAAALALGVDGIELDVHATLDGVAVVHHDPELGRISVERSPLRERAIASLSSAELATFELAVGVAVPTLVDVLALVGGRATVYIEIKAAAAESATLALIDGHAAWTSVHSFDHRVPRRVRIADPRVDVGVLSNSYLIDNLRSLRDANARDLWQHWSMIDATLVEGAHQDGRRVIAWTVNDPSVMRTLAALGVDAVCTDVASTAIAALSAR